MATYLAAAQRVVIPSLTILLVSCSWLRADESLEARRDRLERLPPSKSAELIEKKRRFDELKPEQQEQLRQLHDQVSRDPEAERLQLVLARYTEWLKTLPSGQRAELLSLSADQRIEKIKEVLEEQRKQQYRRFVDQPPPEGDVKAISQWFGEFIERNKERILAELSPTRREKIAKMADPKLRPGAIYFWYTREQSGLPAIAPSEEDISQLKSKLSLETWKLLEQLPPPQKLARLQQWIAAAMFQRNWGNVTDEELSRFYKEDLAPTDRERLDSLPREEARRALRHFYFRHQWTKEGNETRQPFPGRPFGPPGEGPRGDGPRGNGPRGPRDEGRRGPGDPPKPPTI